MPPRRSRGPACRFFLHLQFPTVDPDNPEETLKSIFGGLERLAEKAIEKGWIDTTRMSSSDFSMYYTLIGNKVYFHKPGKKDIYLVVREVPKNLVYGILRRRLIHWCQ